MNHLRVVLNNKDYMFNILNNILYKLLIIQSVPKKYGVFPGPYVRSSGTSIFFALHSPYQHIYVSTHTCRALRRTFRAL